MTQRSLDHPEKTQRRRGAEGTSLDCPVWRGSGRRTAGNRWARKPLRKQAFVPISWPSGLRSASAGLAASLLQSITGRGTPPSHLKEKIGRIAVPLARRPVRRPAATDACIRSRRSSHRRQAIQSPVVLPSISGTAFQAQRPPLCVFASLRGGDWAGFAFFAVLWDGWVDLGLSV